MRTKNFPAHHAINSWIAKKYITEFYRGKRNRSPKTAKETEDVRDLYCYLF
jgi:hypothetical protein